MQQSEIQSLKHNLQRLNESNIELRIQLASEIDTLSNNVTAGIATIQLQQSLSVISCMGKTNETYYRIENLTEVIQHSLRVDRNICLRVYCNDKAPGEFNQSFSQGVAAWCC